MNISYKINDEFKEAAIKVMDRQGRVITSTKVDGNSGSTAIAIQDSVVSGDIIVVLVVDGESSSQPESSSDQVIQLSPQSKKKVPAKASSFFFQLFNVLPSTP